MYVVNGNKNSTTNAWYNVEDGGNVLRDAVNNAYDGAIYVMHPARTETALSMDEICKQLYDQGYRFCTMSQLFEYKGITPLHNKTYHDVNG
jgi:peptidoglycan/xylan/chitin deacetylase (PgdA/CDA1 family)